uniref:Uncharacterized protein n=1 Tax=Knipowitschia caucasica TaxID=637954 RepID=A0AAV2KVF4_KNICA
MGRAEAARFKSVTSTQNPDLYRARHPFPWVGQEDTTQVPRLPSTSVSAPLLPCMYRLHIAVIAPVLTSACRERASVTKAEQMPA